MNDLLSQVMKISGLSQAEIEHNYRQYVEDKKPDDPLPFQNWLGLELDAWQEWLSL
jgi:hypothetical protein